MSRARGLCGLFLVLWMGTVQGASLDERLALIEHWLDAQRAYNDIPGLSAAAVHGSDIVWSAAWGMANRESGKAATPQTLYSICSISKLFTAIAVMQLRDAGELSLDDPVSSHLEDFDIQQAYPDGPPLTLWGLLTHSSGLPREADSAYWSPPDFDFPTMEQIRERLAGQTTLYPAQTYFQYSNLALSLLGEVVAQVSGQSFDAYVQQSIIQPLSLADTAPAIPYENPRMARGYAGRSRAAERAPVPPFDARGITPAAGFSSSAEDLARFAAWQFQVLSGESQAVLGRNSLREMQRVQWMDPGWKISRGLGFGVYRADDVTYVGHSGACPGYRSTLRMQTDDAIGVALAANAGDGNLPLELYATRIHQILRPVLAEDAPDDPAQLPPAFQAFLGTYSSEPWGGESRVIAWDGGLAILYLPSDQPLDGIDKLKHVEGDRFVRIREDGQEGEPVVFMRNDSDEVIALRRHENAWPRVEGLP